MPGTDDEPIDFRRALLHGRLGGGVEADRLVRGHDAANRLLTSGSASALLDALTAMDATVLDETRPYHRLFSETTKAHARATLAAYHAGRRPPALESPPELER
jgi:hypothetical protein